MIDKILYRLSPYLFFWIAVAAVLGVLYFGVPKTSFSQVTQPGVSVVPPFAVNDCAKIIAQNQIQSAGTSCAGASPVQSVFGRTGAVVAASNDYNFNQLAGSIAIGQIPNNLITYAKVQQAGASTLLGNPTGAGANLSEITLNGTLAFSGTTLQRAALTGDITASAGSNATTLATVNANVGSFGSATNCVSFTANGKGLITAASATTCTPDFSSLTGSLAIGQIPNSLITLAKLANINANTVLSNWSGSAGAPVANTWPSCAADGLHGLTYTNGTGVLCTAITAGTIGGSTGSTANAALRANGTGGATVQASALIIADTTGSLSRSGNGGIPLQGTNTNDSAASGFVGEFISATGAGVSLTSPNAVDVTSVSLTAGNWRCYGNVLTAPAGSTVETARAGWISTVSATSPGSVNSGAYFVSSFTLATGTPLAEPVGSIRLSLASTTTVYLGYLSVFSVSTNSVSGFLGCDRVR
jgi:Repeat of unknown function (DUF5907)